MIEATRNIALAVGVLVMVGGLGIGLYGLNEVLTPWSNQTEFAEQDKEMQHIPNIAEMHRTIEALREVASGMRARGKDNTH